MGPLAALLRWADDHPEQIPPTCYAGRTVHWTLDIGEDGVTVNPYGRREVVPAFRRSGSRPMPILAVDTADYVLGAVGHGATETQALARASAFWLQMRDWAAASRHGVAIAAIALLGDFDTDTIEHAIGPKERVAVRVCGLWLHRLPEACQEWARIVTLAKGGPEGLCAGCGQIRSLANSLPTSIPAHLVPGAENEVQLAVLPASERIGGGTLPLCIECGHRAASALRALLEDPSRTVGGAGQSATSVVFGVGGPDADEGARAVMALLEYGPNMTTEQVRCHLGLGRAASIHRTMERRGISPVGRQAGRDGQDLWPTAEVTGTPGPGRGTRRRT